MSYVVMRKATINGETKVMTYVEENEADARKKYHSTLSNMYSTEGLEHVMCVLENDYCGQILKESYFAPKASPVNDTIE
jgi:hypothetical protein